MNTFITVDNEKLILPDRDMEKVIKREVLDDLGFEYWFPREDVKTVLVSWDPELQGGAFHYYWNEDPNDVYTEYVKDLTADAVKRIFYRVFEIDYIPLDQDEYPLKLRFLMLQAQEVLNDREVLDFLWRHTSSPEHHDSIMDTIKAIAKLQLYEWLI